MRSTESKEGELERNCLLFDGSDDETNIKFHNAIIERLTEEGYFHYGSTTVTTEASSTVDLDVSASSFSITTSVLALASLTFLQTILMMVS